jgi:site-specific recombinase XerD
VGDLNAKGETRKAPATRADRLKTGWTIGPSEKGMSWEDAEPLFLRSRKLGIYGARKAVKPRTIEEYRWDLKQFFDFMRSRGLTHYNQLTETNILEYVEHLQSKDWSRATQRKYLISLKAFLRWVERAPEAQKEGMQSLVRALPRIGKEVRRKFIPSPEQMDIFRRGFDRTVIWGLRDYTALCFMLDTGARIGEVCNLEPSDLKWDVGLVNLDGKTGERFVPFDTDAMGTLLKEWLRARVRFAHHECKKVFVSRFGGDTTPDTFRQGFSDNMKRTGLHKLLSEGETISCHTVRHYFCTMYLVNGGTLHNLQRITGHKTLDSRFNLPFSFSSSFSRFAWSIFSPPYSFRQR